MINTSSIFEFNSPLSGDSRMTKPAIPSYNPPAKDEAVVTLMKEGSGSIPYSAFTSLGIINLQNILKSFDDSTLNLIKSGAFDWDGYMKTYKQSSVDVPNNTIGDATMAHLSENFKFEELSSKLDNSGVAYAKDEMTKTNFVNNQETKEEAVNKVVSGKTIKPVFIYGIAIVFGVLFFLKGKWGKQ